MSESLLNEIRASKPIAPSTLRERVRALSAEEPARDPFLARFRVAPARARRAGRRWSSRSSAAGAIGLTRDDATGRSADRRLRRGESGPATPAFATPEPQQARRSSVRRVLRGAADEGRSDPARRRPAPALRGRAAPARRRRRGAVRRDEERAANRALARRQHRLASVRGAVRGSRLRADHAPHPDLEGAERDDAALRARHDRGPALRDRGSPGAGRQPRVADRGDAAADRRDPGPAREHDPLRREPRCAEVAARGRPRQAEGPA